MQSFELLGPLKNIKVIAIGRRINQLDEIVNEYGPGRWRKLKGIALIELRGEVGYAELHWYEAHGIGKRRMRPKRFPI